MRVGGEGIAFGHCVGYMVMIYSLLEILIPPYISFTARRLDRFCILIQSRTPFLSSGYCTIYICQAHSPPPFAQSSLGLKNRTTARNTAQLDFGALSIHSRW